MTAANGAQVLQRVPAAVIGVDESGIIALANDRATALVGGGALLLGEEAAHVLPEAVRAALEGNDPSPRRVSVNGRHVQLECQPMGTTSASRGKLLMLTEYEEAA